MRTIEAEEAGAQFGDVLRDVENGATVVVTVRGIPVAKIAPVQTRYRDAAAAIDDWVRYRQERNFTLGGDITIRELIEAGRDRRFASTVRVDNEDLLSDVENGETVILTRQGQPVAQLGPVDFEAEDAAAAMQELYRLRRELRPTLGGISIRELIEEGRE